MCGAEDSSIGVRNYREPGVAGGQLGEMNKRKLRLQKYNNMLLVIIAVNIECKEGCKIGSPLAYR